MVETKTIAGMTLLILLGLGFALVGNVDLEPNHYCEDRQIMAYCYTLSSTSKTCYTQPGRLGGKRCGLPWQQIAEEGVDEPKIVLDPIGPSIKSFKNPSKPYCKSPGGNVLIRCESLA